MHFQDLISNLEAYWKKQGCTILQPYDMEVGAGTFHPATFFGALGKDPCKVAYVQPSRRPTDGRYGENPLRTQYYYQYQVILKPAPADVQGLYLNSLKTLGIDIKSHDVRFVEDDWESPTLGAWGLGWEVWLDSLEVTQFTYFQQIGGVNLDVTSAEITYGLERICMFIQNEYDLFRLKWTDGVSYGDLHTKREIECSKYNFQLADTGMYLKLFQSHYDESLRLINNMSLLPAYEQMLKTSHIFNMLDARGAISQSERPTYIGKVRNLAKRCAEVYLKRD